MRALPIIVALLLATSQSALATGEFTLPPGEGQIQQAISFDGIWEGTIYFDKEAFLSSTGTPETGVKYRLDINGPVVRAFIDEGGSFVEMKPGIFHIAIVETNAIIFGSEAAPNSWVESVVFTMTQKEPNILIVQMTRVVNNRTLPLSDKESKYATRGAGEFSRKEVP